MKLCIYEAVDGKNLPPTFEPYEGMTPKYEVEISSKWADFTLSEAISMLKREGKDLRGLDFSRNPNDNSNRSISLPVNVDVSGCNFSNRIITDSLIGVNFTGCCMENAHFKNVYGYNTLMNNVNGRGLSMDNTVLIEPCMRNSDFRNMKWNYSRICNQAEQYGLYLENSFWSKQIPYSGTERFTGSQISFDVFKESKKPAMKAKMLNNYRKDLKESMTKDFYDFGTKICGGIVAITGIAVALVMPEVMTKVTHLAHTALSTGFLDHIKNIFEGNKMLGIGSGASVVASVSMKTKGSKVRNLAENLYKKVSTKLKLPKMRNSWLTRMNHLLYSSNREDAKTITTILSAYDKMTNHETTGGTKIPFLTTKCGNGFVTVCNSKLADMATKEIMEKVQDNAMKRDERLSFLVPSEDNKPSKAVIFNPDGTSIVINMNKNNEATEANIFDNNGKCIQTMNASGQIEPTPSFTGTLNDALYDVGTNIELINQATTSIKLKYNPETHAMKINGNLIKIVDRKTGFVDNPEGYAVARMNSPNGEGEKNVEVFSYCQGKVIDRSMETLSQLIDNPESDIQKGYAKYNDATPTLDTPDIGMTPAFA